MICQKIALNDTAALETYFLNNSREYNTNKKRPLILVIPGGGYAFTSDREAEPIALKFNSIGCHAAILWYTVYDQVPNVPKNGLIECMQAIAWLRENAEKYCIDPDLIAVCGFSAGGNLALNAAMRWQQEWLDEATKTTPTARKVNLCIDCYGALQFPKSEPGELGFGAALCQKPQTSNMRFFGVENPGPEELGKGNPLTHFDARFCPPMFIWHNGQDELVPVSDALDLASALAKGKVPFELVVFERGEHGLALADRTTARKDSHKDSHTARWFEQCEQWLANYIDNGEQPYGEYPKGLPGRIGPHNL